MKFDPEHYYQAAIERMRQSWTLYRQEASFALAMYAAGLAVECLLRAFRRGVTVFDEKHDLPKLLDASDLLRIDPSTLQSHGLSATEALGYIQNIRTAVNDIHVLWRNDYRYASEDRLRAHLKRSTALGSRIKGDILKVAALRLLNASQKLIDKGYLLWNSERK